MGAARDACARCCAGRGRRGARVPGIYCLLRHLPRPLQGSAPTEGSLRPPREKEDQGDEADQIDDVCALGYAHDNNLCLISNDRFKEQLKGLEQNLLEHWSAWINKNTIKFDFIGDTLFLNRKTLSIDYVDVAKGAGT